MDRTDEKKTIAFFGLMALIFFPVVGYFALQSHNDRVWLSGLQEQMEQVSRQPSQEGCLLTGTLMSPAGSRVKSAHSESECLAYAVKVVVREATSDGDLTETQLPLATGQVNDLQFHWKDKVFDLDLQRTDLELWMDQGSPEIEANFPASSIPSYLPDNSYRGRDGLSYQLSEYLLAEGQQITVLACVDESGRLVPGRTPCLILPGDEARFAAAVGEAVSSGKEREFKDFSAFGFVLAMFALVALMFLISRRAERWEGGQPPLSLRLLLFAIALAFLAAGASVGR